MHNAPGDVAIQFVAIDAFTIWRGLAGAVKETHLQVAAICIALEFHVRGAGALGSIKTADVDIVSASQALRVVGAGGPIVENAPEHAAIPVARGCFAGGPAPGG